MDVREELDIYIPKEAEVRTVPLNRLPRPALRKMGVPLPDRKSADSPDVVWICPAVMKTKDQGPAPPRDALLEKLRIWSNPLQMSFVSSNRTAWELLKDVSSGAGSSRTQPARRDSVPEADQNAVVIYQERVYLFMKRSTRDQGQPKTRRLQPTRRPAGPSASELQPPSPEQDPGGDGRQKMNRVAEEVKEDTLKVRDVSPAWDMHLLPLSSDGEHGPDSPCDAVPGPEPVPETSPQHRSSTDDEEYECLPEGLADGAWSAACDPEQTGPDRSLEQTWAVRKTLGAASSLSREFDFKELEDEEKIAQLKAKFQQDQAALNNLLL